MSNLDFSFFLEPPDLTVIGVLHIEALAPLSIVVAQPGAYYRSQSAPSEHMLYGMLENALGWHIDDIEGFKRQDLLKGLRKQAKKVQGRGSLWVNSDWLNMKADTISSGVGFWSLLQHHVRFEPPHVLPLVERYEDLWSQQLHDNGSSFFGGSRAYDHKLEDLVMRTRTKVKVQEEGKKAREVALVEMGDKKDFKRLALDEAVRLERGKLNYMSVRSAFPQYYVTPKKREYVLPQGPYRFRVRTTEMVSRIITAALVDPAAPLYLGSNDGWPKGNGA